MRNFACWRADDAYAIINPDADALPDHVFRAVHTSVPVQIRDRYKGPTTVVDPDALLKRFLAPRDHVLVPVVGQSGTGKSHLIRWMRIRLPSTQTREVVFVPKAQTNLRDIVRSLAELLPRSEKDQILGQLQGSGDGLNGSQAQRTAILNELHTGLQNDAGDPQSGIDGETESYLLEGLRAVLNDHHLRRHHFLRDGGFAADLAAHVFERPDRYRPAEQRRTFGVTDLPLDIGGIMHSGFDAQQFLSFLVAAEDAMREAAASIVNRHVDRAISRCLNITGDRLIDLMLGIRRRMRDEGKSLVLLIEDFARLQGLDRALLQSLIEQRDDLCVLRTAFACTSGFYDTVAETVRTRLTFTVDMDVPLGAGGGSIDLARLAGRYMNALRHGEAALDAALQAYTGGEEDFAVANSCDHCVHRPICHATFGEADGFGLYPFTTRALEIMADRADPEARQRFKTREFQKHVLRPIALAAPSIEVGRFPDSDILSGLGGVQGFSPTEQRRLEVADPANWQRRQVLLQLWDGGSKAANLPDDLQGAFGLDRIDLPGAPIGPIPPPPPGPKLQGEYDPIVLELANWNNEQVSLSQQAANDIRPLLFKAIDETVDWDSEGLSQTDFRGVAQAFRPDSLYFQKQTTARAPRLVSLTIPANWDDRDERYQTVMALQGLREAKMAGGWTFPGSAEKLACLQECLARWSKDVVRQLRDVDAAQAGWDPAAAALAVRVSMALVTGAEASTSSNLNVVRAGLGPLGPVADFAHPGLRLLVAEVRKLDSDLLAIIAARRSAMKGGTKGDFVDTYVLFEAVAGMRRFGFVPETPPSNLEPKPAGLQQLLKITARLSVELRPALQQEAALRRGWLSEMETAFGPSVRQAEIAAGATELTNLLGRLGLPTTDVAAAKTAFQQCPYDAMVSAVHRLPEPGSEKLADVAQRAEAVIQASRKLAQVMEAALRRAEPDLDARLRLAGIDPDAERTTVAEIDAALADINTSLAEDQHADAA